MRDWVKVSSSEVAGQEVKKGKEGPIFGKAMEAASQPHHTQSNGNAASFRSHLNGIAQKTTTILSQAANTIAGRLQQFGRYMDSDMTITLGGACVMVLVPIFFTGLFMSSFTLDQRRQGFQEGLRQVASPSPVYYMWNASQREVDMVQKVRTLEILPEVEEWLSKKEVKDDSNNSLERSIAGQRMQSTVSSAIHIAELETINSIQRAFWAVKCLDSQGAKETIGTETPISETVEPEEVAPRRFMASDAWGMLHRGFRIVAERIPSLEPKKVDHIKDEEIKYLRDKLNIADRQVWEASVIARLITSFGLLTQYGSNVNA